MCAFCVSLCDLGTPRPSLAPPKRLNLGGPIRKYSAPCVQCDNSASFVCPSYRHPDHNHLSSSSIAGSSSNSFQAPLLVFGAHDRAPATPAHSGSWGQLWHERARQEEGEERVAQAFLGREPALEADHRRLHRVEGVRGEAGDGRGCCRQRGGARSAPQRGRDRPEVHRVRFQLWLGSGVQSARSKDCARGFAQRGVQSVRPLFVEGVASRRWPMQRHLRPWSRWLGRGGRQVLEGNWRGA